MKKTIALLLASGIVSFYACGPSAEEIAAREKATADSIAAVEAQKKAEEEARMKAMQDSIAAAQAMEQARLDSIAKAEEMAKAKSKKPAPKKEEPKKEEPKKEEPAKPKVTSR